MSIYLCIYFTNNFYFDIDFDISILDINFPLLIHEVTCQAHGDERCLFACTHINNLEKAIDKILPPDAPNEVRERVKNSAPSHMGSRTMIQSGLANSKNEKGVENVKQGTQTKIVSVSIYRIILIFLNLSI